MSGQASGLGRGAGEPVVATGPAGSWSANVSERVRAAAGRFPDRPALITGSGVRTWADLDRAVDVGVARLRATASEGVARVLMALPTGPDQAAALLAVLWAGLIAVQVEPTHPDLRWVGRRVGAALAVTDRDDHGCQAAIGTEEIGRWWDSAPAPAGGPGLPGDPAEAPTAAGAAGEDLALLARSGRAGPPVMLSHRAILAALDRMMGAPGFDLGPEDRLIQALPLYHLVGLVSTFLPAASVGAAVVIPDLQAVGRTPPEAVLAAIREHGGTVLPAEPTLYRQLCRADEFADSVAGLRLMLCSAYPLDPADLAAIRAATGLTVRQGYGISESAATATSTLLAPPSAAEPRAGSVGRAYPDVKVRILADDDDDAVTTRGDRPRGDSGDGSDTAKRPDSADRPDGDMVVDPADDGEMVVDLADDGDSLVDLADDGGIGRIAISGPTLFSGYWPDGAGGPGADGWFLTGDIGFLDDDDELHLVDRMAETVVVSGFTVYPREVESVLCDHPAIADAAVIGVSSVIGSSMIGSTASGSTASGSSATATVVAVIVPRPGRMPTVEDLDAFLVDKLAPFKRPTAFQVVDVLPRTEVGRLDRDALRTGFEAGHGMLRPVEPEPTDDADAAAADADAAAADAGAATAGGGGDPGGRDDPGGGAELSEMGKRLPGAADRVGRSEEDTDDDLF